MLQGGHPYIINFIKRGFGFCEITTTQISWRLYSRRKSVTWVELERAGREKHRRQLHVLGRVKTNAAFTSCGMRDGDGKESHCYKIQFSSSNYNFDMNCIYLLTTGNYSVYDMNTALSQCCDSEWVLWKHIQMSNIIRYSQREASNRDNRPFSW